MRTNTLCAAAFCGLAACTSPEPVETSTATTAMTTTGAFAFDDAAVALLSPARAGAFAGLQTKSLVKPRLVVEVASTATTSIELDLPPLGGTPADTAKAFVKRWQPLLDDRVSDHDYQVEPSPAGCAGAVVAMDRFVGGKQVIGSRLTLHFDDRGHLIFVTNGVAPVPATVVSVDPKTLPGARPLADVVGKQIDVKRLKRVPVLAPMPDGSGLHQADVIGFVDARGKLVATLAVGTTAITGVLDPISDDHPRPPDAPEVHIDAGEVVPSVLRYTKIGGIAINGLPIERNPIEHAFRYLETHATPFHSGQARCQFTPRAVQESHDGDVHVRLAQRHGTLPIFGAELAMTFAGDRIESVFGHTIDNLDMSLTPAVSSANALATADHMLDVGTARDPAWTQMVAKSRSVAPTIQLGVLPRWAVRPGGSVNSPTNRLAWKVQRGAFTVYVDAQDGTVRNADSGVEGAAVVTDANGMNEFAILIPGYTLESVENVHVAGAPFNIDTTPGRVGGNTGSALVAVEATYGALGWIGQRNHGGDFVANTNVNAVTLTCPNSFFDSTFTNTAFFCPGWAVDDMVGHEITHGVIAASSGMGYQDESGAINEAFADVMGNLIFREAGGGWLIGEDILPGGAIRDMTNFAHMSTFQHRDSTCDGFPWSCDHGFVHTNSAIINKAHQLLADGVPGATPGIGRDKLMKLAFETMTTRLTSGARMNDVPLAERDVCERFVALGTTDLTHAPFTSMDCNQIETAFLMVGLDPGLVTGWSEPTLGFTGSHTFFPGELTPGLCPVTNVEANLVQLWNLQTIDMDPTTPVPPSVTFGGALSSLAMRVPAGTPPFPIGSPLKTFTVDWSAIYGVTPSFYGNVIINPACPPLVEQTAPSAVFSEGNLFGNTSSTTWGNPTSGIDPHCVLMRSELELLDGAGNTVSTGLSPSDPMTIWFLFIPVQFDINATVGSPPSPILGSSPQNLSGSFSYGYALGRTLRIRWRYHFAVSAPGVTCTP